MLTPEQKHLLNAKKIIGKKVKDSTIYYEGDNAATFYMIRKGLIKQVRQISLDEEYFGDYRKEGELTGLASIRENAVYSTSAVCLTDVEYCAFPNHFIIAFAQSNYKATQYFFDCFTQTVISAGNKIQSLIKCPAKNRLAQTLLLLGNYLPQAKQGFEVKREELAMLSGMTRETISRQLAVLKREKHIAIKDSQIKILNAEKLKKLCDCSKN